MKTLILFSVGGLSAVIAFATNWLALIPWRRTRNQHWTERARVYHPVRVGAVADLWALPALLTIAVVLLWPDQSPHWGWVAFFSAGGVLAGTIPMDREVFPRIPLKDLLRYAAVNWLIRFMLWFVFLTAVALMPDEFNAYTAIIVAAVVTLCILWNQGGWLYVGRKLGIFVPPVPRLLNIVRDTAAGMKVPFNEVCLVRAPVAQAFAIPGGQKLLFTERLLQLLSDDEIAAICAHELGHLTEARKEYLQRYVLWLFFLPWLFLKPMVHTIGVPGFFIVLFTSVFMPFLYRRVSHKLEIRADRIACSTTADPGTYARALTLLHEDNLLPAVHAKEHATHPHLYDRLLAAGVIPEFPRPAPCDSMAWHGTLFSVALGMLAMALIFRLTQQF